MKKFAIDLLWVRPNKVGGTEFYIRNILDGLLELSDKYQCVLFVSRDNAESFMKYEKDNRFSTILCGVESANIIRRILWQNFFLSKVLIKNNIYTCFEPVYCKPIFTSSRVRFITTIHDLQALHYPEYQSRLKVLWLKFNWWNTVKTSDKIIAISNFVRSDILEHYKVPSNRVITIYNAVVLDIENILPFEMVGKKFGIDIEEYFYTVSSMAPHKNLTTLIHVMAKLKKENLDLPKKLVITGIGGSARQTLIQLIEDFNLVDNIILTGFIETAERNTLYKYCHTFLFPSIFEGFGFPPVEAMMFGRPVVTTSIPCLREVTLGYAQYVEDPYSVDEWLDKLIIEENENTLISKIIGLYEIYNAKRIVSLVYKNL